MSSARPVHPTLSIIALVACVLLSWGSTASAKSAAVDPALASQAVQAYATHVHESYVHTLREAEGLKKAVDAFVARPSAKGLAKAKARWVSARVPYGKTEVFRFYEGPIDAPERGDTPEGPEGRLNAWPMNEAYLDSVKGKPKAGIIHDASVPITREALLARNATEDEAEVTLGWHAIEFMLWGQDLAADGPGARSWRAFAGKKSAPTRRRAYLALLAQLLVDDLQGLVQAWSPTGDTYHRHFTQLPPATALSHIMSAMATLSGFELASERIAVSLDSRSQEDEHSCFSDTTHQDIAANAWGVREVYLGGLHALALATAPVEAKALEALVRETTQLADACPRPVDQVLIAPDSDPRRVHLQTLVTALQRQAEALQALGKKMGVSVLIHAE